MRRAARIDENQNDIVDYLRDKGASVQSLAQLGKGVPDIMVGWKGKNWLFEIKRKGKRKELTEDEAHWLAQWRGVAYVVETGEEAWTLMKENP